MTLLNLCASFGASTFLVCGGGFAVMVAVTAVITVTKNIIGAIKMIRH